MVNWIMKVAKEKLMESRSFGPKDKKIWQFSYAIVQHKVKIERECYNAWQLCKMKRIEKNIR